MSNADALVEKLKTDSALKNKFKAAGPDGFEQTAAAAGLPCTKDDFKAALKAKITDAALDTAVVHEMGTIGLGQISVI